MSYTFLFDQMTIGDYAAIQSAVKTSDMAALMLVIDRFTVGGVLHLPLSEFNPVLDAFGRAFLAHMQRSPDNPAVARLLHSALGDKD